mmetsp:Transcript_20805/g.37172  ORF Transcript_20805/g.37172 Transcript_20805/m.37172 type:complete len:83 (-) Transcript_20805:177-425(-)
MMRVIFCVILFSTLLRALYRALCVISVTGKDAPQPMENDDIWHTVLEEVQEHDEYTVVDFAAILYMKYALNGIFFPNMKAAC